MLGIVHVRYMYQTNSLHNAASSSSQFPLETDMASECVAVGRTKITLIELVLMKRLSAASSHSEGKC